MMNIFYIVARSKLNFSLVYVYKILRKKIDSENAQAVL